MRECSADTAKQATPEADATAARMMNLHIAHSVHDDLQGAPVADGYGWIALIAGTYQISDNSAAFLTVLYRSQMPAIVNLHGLQQQVMLIRFREILPIAVAAGTSHVAVGARRIGFGCDRLCRGRRFADRVEMHRFECRPKGRCVFMDNLIKPRASSVSRSVSRCFESRHS